MVFSIDCSVFQSLLSYLPYSRVIVGQADCNQLEIVGKLVLHFKGGVHCLQIVGKVEPMSSQSPGRPRGSGDGHGDMKCHVPFLVLIRRWVALLTSALPLLVCPIWLCLLCVLLVPGSFPNMFERMWFHIRCEVWSAKYSSIMWWVYGKCVWAFLYNL